MRGGMPTFFKDLSSDRKREQTEDMLRVYWEMQKTAVSTFENVIRLLIAVNAGGILLISGLIGALQRSDSLLILSGVLFLIGLCCAGAPTVLLLRRFQKLAAQTMVDQSCVHANKLSVEDFDERLAARTNRPGFASAIHYLHAGAIVSFILGALAALVAVASL